MGKGLAAISKQTKEWKTREKIRNEMDEQNDSNWYNYIYIFGLMGVLISIAGLYYTQKRFI